MFAVKSSWIAIACAILFLMQDGAWAHVGTRTTEGRYSLGRRNSNGGQTSGRGAGCGQVKSNEGPPYAGKCVCFDDTTTKAVFGESPEVVDFANKNGYKYPQSTSNNGRCNFPGGGNFTLDKFNDNCCGYKCTFGPCGTGDSLVCLKEGQICQSGVPVTPTPKNPCPSGKTKCFVAKKSKRNLYECIDTKKDLESCGGCLYPDPAVKNSTVHGVDCSAIGNVKDVSCVNGKCAVKSCVKGYYVADNCCKEEHKKKTW